MDCNDAGFGMPGESDVLEALRKDLDAGGRAPDATLTRLEDLDRLQQILDG